MSVVVEAHRRRVTVKVTPMQSLLVVVEETLSQLKLVDIDPQSCKLIYKKRSLDLTCPFRLANLPSGAKVELITGREPQLGVHDSTAPTPSAPVRSPPIPPAGPEGSRSFKAANPAQAARPDASQDAQHQDGLKSNKQAVRAMGVALRGSAASSENVSLCQSQMHITPMELQRSGQHVQQRQEEGGRQKATPLQSNAAMDIPMPAPVPAAAAHVLQQAPSVSVFGQEVVVFTREAELTLESSHMALEERDPPDDFYEVTEGDLLKAQAGLARAKAKAEGGGALMTKQMRAAEEAQRAASYGPVVIRASLPDGHVLQCTFQATHPLSKLLGVVRRAVVPEVGDRLHLYTTPPKVVLKDLATTSFYQAKLIPAARVHVGIQGHNDPATPLLRPEVLALMGPPPEKAAVLQSRGEAAAPVGGGNGVGKRRGEGYGERGNGVQAAPGVAGSAERKGVGGAPKWLKLAKK